MVLGLYLALTRFNVRYLYISLVGLSFEAVGACIYCISNTRTSKLTRRKQRVSNANNNAYMLNGGTSNNVNQGNSNSNQNNLNSILHISNPHVRGQQAHTSDLNHILEARTPRSVDDNTRVYDEPPAEATSPDLMTGDTNSNAQPPQSCPPRVQSRQTVDEQVANLNVSQNDNTIGGSGKEENSVVIINVLSDSSHPPAPESTSTFPLNSIACNVEQLPNIDGCQLKTQELSNNTALASHSHHEDRVGCAEATQGTLGQTSTTLATNTTNSSSQNKDNTSLRLNQISGDIPSETPSSTAVVTFEQQVGTSASSHQQQQHQQQNLISTDNSTSRLTAANSIDLIQLSLGNEDSLNITTALNNTTSSPNTSHGGLVPSAPYEHQMSSMKRSPGQGQRNVHLRRTLVMGLGGEEELMEIDEEDLDNMSILPPSYDSIAQNRS